MPDDEAIRATAQKKLLTAAIGDALRAVRANERQQLFHILWIWRLLISYALDFMFVYSTHVQID